MAQFRILDATNRSLITSSFELLPLEPRLSPILKFLEEDDEDKTIHPEDAMDAFQASLIQVIKAQDSLISDFQNNTPLPINATPSQESVTKDQTVGPSSPVVYVKQEPIDQSFDQAQKPRFLVKQGVTTAPVKQNNAIPISSNADLDKQSSKMVLSKSPTCARSRTMANSPVTSETIPKRANVRKTPKLPSVGQKKPSRKKQKLCGNSSDGSTKKLNDVTAVSGINLWEEEKQLLSSGPKKDGYASKTSRSVEHKEEEQTILRKVPLQRKLTEIMVKSGLKHIGHDVEQCLSLCVQERMRRLLSNLIRMSKLRLDAEKFRNGSFITSDIRKEISERNQKAKEEWKERNAGKEKNEDNDTKGEKRKKEDNDTNKAGKRSKQVKAKKEYEHKMRANDANVTAHKAVGGESGDDTFRRWKLMAGVRQKTSPGPLRNLKKLFSKTGGRGFERNQGSTNVVRSISVKDVIAVVEKEPEMSRSTLLYRLYNRVC